jgi:hypothetical protein
LKATASLSVTLRDIEVRKSLTSVLSPDNEGLPRGLHLRMRGDKKEIVFSAESESPSTAISTALALLKDITLFQEIWLLSRTGRA